MVDKMPHKNIFVLIFALVIVVVIATKIAHVPDILSKFHQGDYEIKFEWAEVKSFNKRYYKNLELHTFKYNRTTTAINVTFMLNEAFNNEMEVIFQAYRFASNEYRYFPIRVQLNFCESIKRNAMGFNDLTKCGNFSCPLLKNRTYRFCNWKPDEAQFPPFIPSGSYMLEMQGVFHDEEVFVERYYGTVSRPFVK